MISIVERKNVCLIGDFSKPGAGLAGVVAAAGARVRLAARRGDAPMNNVYGFIGCGGEAAASRLDVSARRAL